MNGSFSTATREGTTFATLGQGEITIGGQTGEAIADQLAGLNRDLDTAQVVTRDSSFSTGDLEVDVGALLRVGENIGAIKVELITRLDPVLRNARQFGEDLRSGLNQLVEDGLLPEEALGENYGRLSRVLQQITAPLGEDPEAAEVAKRLEQLLQISPGLNDFLAGQDTQAASNFALLFTPSPLDNPLVGQLQPTSSQVDAVRHLALNATPEEEARLVAALCSLTHCARGVPERDPNFEDLKILQDAGALFGDEIALLLATGEFDFDFFERRSQSVSDFLSRNAEWVENTTDTLGVVGGGLAVAGGVGLASGAVTAGGASCGVTLGAGCVGAVAGATAGVLIVDQGRQQASAALDRLFTPFEDTIGNQIVDALDLSTPTPDPNTPLRDATIAVGLVALEGTLGRLGLRFGRGDGGGFSVFPGRRGPDGPRSGAGANTGNDTVDDFVNARRDNNPATNTDAEVGDPAGFDIAGGRSPRTFSAKELEDFAPTIASRNPRTLSDGSVIDNHGFVYTRHANGSVTSRAATADQLSESGIRLDYGNISTVKRHQSATPRNQAERDAFDRVRANPAGGRDLGLDRDARFASNGFRKFSRRVPGPNGRNIDIHYQYNPSTGQVVDVKVNSPIGNSE